jgi:hypothetical protein
MKTRLFGQMGLGGAACVLLLALGGAGCGGITASKSISPLDFFLPGLLQNDPPRPPAADSPTALVCVQHESSATIDPELILLER